MRPKRNTYIFEVYENDSKIFEGSAREVGEYFYSTPTTVYTTYLMNYKYLGKYVLKKRRVYDNQCI